MKLGDNMTAAVDGCNIWGHVCPRKTRPPRIGEIPRHVAIDEESPGSSTHRLSVISPGGTKSSVLDIPVDSPRATDTHVTGEQTFLGKNQVTPEDRFENNSNQKGNNKDSPSFIPERIVSANRRLPRVSTGEKITLNRSNSTSQLPDVLNNSYHGSVISTILSVRDKLSHGIGSLGASFETVNAKTKWRSYFCDSSSQVSDLRSSIETGEFPDHIDLEARKDSAVCLEESHDFSSVTERLLLDKNSQDTGLSSYMITSKEIPSGCATPCYQDHDNNLDQDDNSINRRSLIAKYNRPRRESSGYCSNLSTFDEDRRNSTCEAFQGITTLRERRRSSTKRFTTNTRFFREEEIERMPTIEIYRKVSTAGIEMPNIDEIEDIRGSFQDDLNSQTLKLDAFPDSQTPKEKKGSIKKTIFDRYHDSEMDMCRRISSVTGDMPDIHEDREPSDMERIMKECLHETEVISARLAQTTLTGRETCKDSFAASLKKTSLTGESSMKIMASATLKLKETIQSQDGEHEKMRSENSRYQEEIVPSPKNRQKKRLIHQDSSPSCSIPELPCIPEKSCESSYKADNTIILVNHESAGSITEETSDNDNDDEAEEDPRKLLPRSIKVYQLLSTQSEDRGDGEPRLMDRRISLQISRHEDEESPCVTLACPEDKRLLHADSVPLLKISEIQASGSTVRELSPIRKLSSPGESATIHKLGDHVGIRPIYPYCPYSPYGSPQGSPRTHRRPLRESRRVSIDNRQGALQLNQYKLLDNIGQGSFGIVKLAYNEEDETHYAMKILSKKKLMKKAGIFGRMAPGRKGTSSPLAKVYREIALLKKLDHPHVVKLVEVLDDPDEDNLYLVFELVQKGEVLELPTDKPLDEETARINFRHVVMGVEYLHYQRIVHRDIKPSNLLVDNEGRVKVADLGVSAELRASGDLLSGCAGTPAFAAPETTTPGAQYSGTLCDVWSMGATLYSLVTGKLPWDGSGSIIGVQAAVRSEPLRFPDKPVVSDDLRDLISHMLAKDPAMRFTLTEIKSHRWLTNHGKEPLPNEADNCRLPVTVTDEEVARVVTRVPKLDTLILIKTMLKQHSFQNPFLPRRIVKPTSVNDAISSNLKTCIADNCDGAEKRERSMKSEQFHKAGRSNSAPDSYDWQTNGRQVSIDTPLTPVTEATVQEIEIEKP